MLPSIWSFLGWKEEPSPSPPPVTITGVRIPADGTPAHLLSLTTISDSRATDSFLFHVPDLRRYWHTERAWDYRDLHRLDLLEYHHVQQQRHVPLEHLRQMLSLQRQHNHQQQHHLRQRYLLNQRYHLLQQCHSSFMGTYYVFYSFATDDLPKNSSVPTWISDKPNGYYYGDVFLVKMAPHEYGEYGWAAYEDIVPEFLDLLREGPLDT